MTQGLGAKSRALAVAARGLGANTLEFGRVGATVAVVRTADRLSRWLDPNALPDRPIGPPAQAVAHLRCFASKEDFVDWLAVQRDADFKVTPPDVPVPPGFQPDAGCLSRLHLSAFPHGDRHGVPASLDRPLTDVVPVGQARATDTMLLGLAHTHRDHCGHGIFRSPQVYFFSMSEDGHAMFPGWGDHSGGPFAASHAGAAGNQRLTRRRIDWLLEGNPVPILR